MIDFYNSRMEDIVPDNFRASPEVQAISCAVENQIKKLVKLSKKAGVYAVIDILDEPELDLLAVELRTQYYAAYLTVKEKREVIKKTLLWYYRAGTLSTVQELTDFIFQDAKIEEWFQYDGAAFVFRLIINITEQDITLEKYMDYLKSLHEVKNTRSHLEAIIYQYRKDLDVKAAAVGNTGNCLKVKTATAEEIKAGIFPRCAAAVKTSQRLRIKAEQRRP